jgi:hypothetical protein
MKEVFGVEVWLLRRLAAGENAKSVKHVTECIY